MIPRQCMATEWEHSVSFTGRTAGHQARPDLQLTTFAWSVNVPWTTLDDFQFDGLSSLRRTSLHWPISCYLFSKLNLVSKPFLQCCSDLIFLFFLGSQGKVLDSFHNKSNISDYPLLLCNENSHELKVRKLGFESSFLSGLGQVTEPFRIPSVGSQGPIWGSSTILSFI